jgi:hypothetical protein
MLKKHRARMPYKRFSPAAYTFLVTDFDLVFRRIDFFNTHAISRSSNSCCRSQKSEVHRLCKRTQVLLERDYNSSWMLRVLGKLMGSNNLR